MGQRPLAVYGDVEGRIEEERARVEAEYRQVLKSSVQFEKRIRTAGGRNAWPRTGESPSWRSASPTWSGALGKGKNFRLRSTLPGRYDEIKSA